MILKKEPSKILKSSETFPESVKMADGRVVRVEKCVQIQITIGNCQFTEEFLILQNMTSMLLGLPFFRKYNIVIHPYKGLLYLPDLTISLASPIKNKKLSKSQILHTVSKTTIHPNQQEIIECELINPDRAYEYTS